MILGGGSVTVAVRLRRFDSIVGWLGLGSVGRCVLHGSGFEGVEDESSRCVVELMESYGSGGVMVMVLNVVAVALRQ